MFLRQGFTGPEVVALQTELKNHNFDPGPLDGIFGQKTKLAVIAFQGMVHLTPDGVVGPATESALLSGTDEPGPITTLAQVDARFRKGTVDWYEAAYKICNIDPKYIASAIAATTKALKLKADYQWGEEQTGVPWTMLLGCHLLECDNNPKGVLHNGQLIVGTGRKTTIVPIGRGPFDTFRASIIDAVKLQGLLNSVKVWTLGMQLKQSELFNGAGYLNWHPKENSPYLWARTDINDGTGKYVSDGKWDENANADAQVSVACVYKILEDRGEFKPIYAT